MHSIGSFPMQDSKTLNSMRRVIDYTIVSNHDYNDFFIVSRNLLNDGWKPQGGVCVFIESYPSPAWKNDTWERRVYSQAFIRKEPLFKSIKRFLKIDK